MNEVSKVMLQIDLHCANDNAYRDHIHARVERCARLREIAPRYFAVIRAIAP